MSPTVEKVLQDALVLPEKERLELIDVLIAATPETTPPPFDEAWREVIERRSSQINAGEVELVPWETVRQGIRQRLGLDG